MTLEESQTPDRQHEQILAHLARRDFWWRLPGELEQEFCRDQDERSVRGFNATIGVLALLYFGLGVSLVAVVGFDDLGMWPASYGVFLVLLAVAWLLSMSGVLERHYQLLVSLMTSVALIYALVHPSLVEPGILYYLVHEGTIFVMVIVFLGLSLRLTWALAISIGGGILALGLLSLFQLPVNWPLSLSTYLGGMVLGAVVRYRDERHLRRAFLHNRLLQLDNERIQHMAERLERLSFIDGLTGLANRRYFDASLDKAWRSCMREKAPLTLIMLDVDFFKPYNDSYGHQQGDQALRELASIIAAQAVRPQDLVARYGGEEFVVLLPWVDERGAAIMAERLLQAVRERNMPHSSSRCADHVTISAGVVTRVPDMNDSPAALISAADDALYEAKRNGRDRWVKAS